MYSLRFAFLALTLGLVALSPAHAATSPVKGTSAVNAAVANSCLVQSSDSLSFGAYNPTSGLASSTSGKVLLRCTKSAAYSISPTSGGTTLRGGGGNLSYGLYTDGAFSKQWGASGFTSIPINNTQSNVYAAFTKSYTRAQWLADPSLNNGAYYYANGTYFTGYVGQSSGAVPGATNIQMKVSTYTVPIINHIADVSTLPKSTGNGQFDSYLYFVLPADTTQYSGSAGNYTVKFPSTTTQSLSGTSTSGLTAQSQTYYAQLPAGQDLPPGTYTDTVVITVSF